MERVALIIPPKKRIALIAHDSQKADIVDWCTRHKSILRRHNLCGTGTTAGLIARKTGLVVEAYNSGPLGGDQQIGAEVVCGRVDLIIFLCDPLTAQPHDPDVKALLRISQVYGVPIATNLSTADFIITSPLMESSYQRHVIRLSRAEATQRKETQI
jgi:methylglyoxal synthase